MKFIDKFKAALEKRVDLMLHVSYLIAIENGCNLDEDEFLVMVRDRLKEEPKEGE